MEKFDKNDIKRLRQLVDYANSIVITAHMTPDGDAIGSALGLCHVLGNLGKDAKVVVPDRPNQQLKFLPGFRYIETFSVNPDFAAALMQSADLIFCLDYNEPARIDRMAPALEAATAQKVLIDHHLHPADFCQIMISRPVMSSTCELLFNVLCAMELFDAIDRQAAECILAGMMTDTGNFNYNANNPDTYRIVAHLLEKGVNRDRLSKLLFDTFTLDSMRLNAYAIYEKMKVWEDKGAALITLDRDELNRLGYKRGYTEGLVNKPLAIEKVQYSIYLRQEDGYVKVSMRSKGDFPCNVICREHFNGGGHLNASGGEFYGTMEQCVAVVESLLDENYEKYILHKKQ